MTVDFISEVAFGESLNLLVEAENNTFNAPFLASFDLALETVWDLMYFPVIRVIVNNAPPILAARLSPSAARYQGLISAVTKTVTKFRQSGISGKNSEQEVLFDSMSHLDDKVMLAEALDILVAGSDTTATTLSVAIEEMVKKPSIFKRLKTELVEAGIVTEQDYTLTKLEPLPYLVGIPIDYLAPLIE